MIVMVYVNFNIFEKKIWPKMANFYFGQALEAYNVIFTSTFVQNLTKKSDTYFFNFFGNYFSLVKKLTREKGKAKKYF